jgi:tetratricopeptide (TPR) repeat protein
MHQFEKLIAPMFLVCNMAFAANGPTAHIVGTSLVVNQNGESQIFELPTELLKNQTFAVKIPKPKPAQTAQQTLQTNAPIIINGGGGATVAGTNQSGSAGFNPSQNPTGSTQPSTPDPRTLVFTAKKYFSQKRYDAAMDQLNHAEKIQPEDSLIKSMKGSLFYIRGMKEDARRYWEDSLRINPQQPTIQAYLDKLGPKPKEEAVPGFESGTLPAPTETAH